jgi:hypothetical protein
MFAEIDGDDKETSGYEGSDPSSKEGSVVYASDDDDSDESGEGDSYVYGEGTGRAMDCLIEWMLEGTFSYDFKMVMQVDGVGVEAKGSLASADGGERYDAHMEMLMMGTKVVYRVVQKDDTVYVIDDENKMIVQMAADQADSSTTAGMKTDYSNFSLVGSGIGEFGGKTLPFEDYRESTTGETIRFFLEDDQVYGIFMEVEGVTLEMVITNPSNSVPEWAFELPKGYNTTYYAAN